jgi:hypothetical protein
VTWRWQHTRGGAVARHRTATPDAERLRRPRFRLSLEPQAGGA